MALSLDRLKTSGQWLGPIRALGNVFITDFRNLITQNWCFTVISDNFQALGLIWSSWQSFGLGSDALVMLINCGMSFCRWKKGLLAR